MLRTRIFGGRHLRLELQTFSSRNAFHSDSNDAFRRIRIYKRAFAFSLFGVTFASVFYLRNKKRSQIAPFFEHSKLLRGHNFGSLTLYEYDGYVIAEPVLKQLHQITSFEFRETDVVLCSFPKTGTTWLQEIVYLIATDLNYEQAKCKNISDRFPYLEFPVPGINWLKLQKGDRFIKTHLPLHFLENAMKSNAKIVAILRNPKDVLVSFYYFARMNNIIDYKGDFNSFFDKFISDKVPYGPIWKHYSDFLLHHAREKAHSNRILIIYYEDLQTNFEREVDKICQFFDKPKLSDDEMRNLKKHCSFESMSLNPSVNYEHWDAIGVRKKGETLFMRKGIVGDWKAHFSDEQNKIFNKWMEQNFVKSIFERYVD
ncbi:estrogen sulfotransferase-like protein [Dinothrombium tinctorium]|uniref:Estrogen sulfotransferase-like protein n=1 Tax=Dinothrombium tinctorium TaxID=1965070 RepID=A0A443QIW6_9ACAR|nr:estrogen sulfotransferase-like protein [Dinothrombium tinctorium]